MVLRITCLKHFIKCYVRRGRHSLAYRFPTNTKAHLKRLKATGRPEILMVNGRAELIVQNAAAFEDMLDAIRGIQRGLEGMKAGTGRPARKVFEEIRAKYQIPRSKTKTHQAWVDEALAGGMRPGSAARLRQIASKVRAKARVSKP